MNSKRYTITNSPNWILYNTVWTIIIIIILHIIPFTPCFSIYIFCDNIPLVYYWYKDKESVNIGLLTDASMSANESKKSFLCVRRTILDLFESLTYCPVNHEFRLVVIYLVNDVYFVKFNRHLNDCFSTNLLWE